MWQKHPLFRFFASVRLAIILLGVLIVASIAGTIYESSFDANVARTYVYGAPWFTIWLLLLAINLTASAFSRWPWKRKHVGFLLTHLGIIILLIGAVIGRWFGIEGTMTLAIGNSPSNQLVINEKQLYLIPSNRSEQASAVRTFPVSIVGRRQPSEEKPWFLGFAPDRERVELIGYSPNGLVQFHPIASPNPSNPPAIHVRLFSPRLKRSFDSWLLIGSPENQKMDLGMAAVRVVTPSEFDAASQLKTATATETAPIAAAHSDRDVDESIFVFANTPTSNIRAVPEGKSGSGIDCKLDVSPSAPAANAASTEVKPKLIVEHQSASWELDVDPSKPTEDTLGGSGLQVTIEKYWPDFQMVDGKPTTKSQVPNNPVALVHITGQLKDIPTNNSPAIGQTLPNGKQNPKTESQNELLVSYNLTEDLSYILNSPGQKTVGDALPSKRFQLKEPVSTGWADWKMEVDEVIPHAAESMHFEPYVKTTSGPPMATGIPTDGIWVQIQSKSPDGTPNEPMRQWVPNGWPTVIGTGSKSFQIAYGWRVYPMPIGLQLTRFDVERNEGTNDPAGYKSEIQILAPDGQTSSGSCWMNNPFNYPNDWIHTFTGLTYKISQANYTEGDLSQSGVQILRDPGWLFKWTGSLIICIGIFMLFYLRDPVGIPKKKQSEQV